MSSFIGESFSFFIAKILRRLPVSNRIKIAFNKKRHQVIERKLQSLFASSLELSRGTVNRGLNNLGPIWVFWWQGKNSMPKIVRQCYKSIQKNSGKRKVILVTKDNFLDYTDISSRIISLLESNRITFTHFSDILRFNLLKNNGGLWLDSTIFVNKPISNKYFQRLFTCSGYDDEDLFFVTKGKWCGFLIGGTKHSQLFEFMDIFFRRYWENNDKLIDYFLIDYALDFAWKHDISDFRKFTERHIHKDNPDLFTLAPLLNRKFDEKLWIEISKNTEMYKLSYKMRLSKDMNTFYNKIINSED